jgi:hypothetical protein
MKKFQLERDQLLLERLLPVRTDHTQKFALGAELNLSHSAE